jgi:hypothetical protein
MKKVGLFKKSEEKTKVLAAVKELLEKFPDRWKAVPDTIGQYSYYEDGKDQPLITIKNDGIFLKICKTDTVYVYGIWEGLRIEGLLPLPSSKELLEALSWCRYNPFFGQTPW